VEERVRSDQKPSSTRAKRHARVAGADDAAARTTSPATYREPIKVTKPTAIRILFLAANPADTVTLKLDREIDLINVKVHEAEFGNLFDIQPHSGVRSDQLQGLLLKYQPHIVHFSGHASSSSQIILENHSGQSHPVSPEALSHLFFRVRGNIRFVVLNACYTEAQAQAIAQHIEWVIGMSKAISDSAAIAFAGSFYRALGYGYTVADAFDLACNEIDLSGLGEADTPKLLGPKTDANVFPSSNHLAQDLLSRSAQKRLQAAKELTGIPQQHLTPLLIHRSAIEPNGSVRFWIYRALGKVGSAVAIEALRKNRNDPEPFARLGVEEALEECGEV